MGASRLRVNTVLSIFYFCLFLPLIEKRKTMITVLQRTLNEVTICLSCWKSVDGVTCTWNARLSALWLRQGDPASGNTKLVSVLYEDSLIYLSSSRVKAASHTTPTWAWANLNRQKLVSRCSQWHRTSFWKTISEWCNYKLQPTRCNFSWIYLFLQTLYMFQAVPPPIIRST